MHGAKRIRSKKTNKMNLRTGEKREVTGTEMKQPLMTKVQRAGLVMKNYKNMHKLGNKSCIYNYYY